MTRRGAVSRVPGEAGTSEIGRTSSAGPVPRHLKKLASCTTAYDSGARFGLTTSGLGKSFDCVLCYPVPTASNPSNGMEKEG